MFYRRHSELEFETNPWQIAQAYQVFANGGVMNDAHLITKIENAAGQVGVCHIVH